MSREGWGALALVSGFVASLLAVALIGGPAWAGLFAGLNAMTLGILLLRTAD